MKMIYFYIKFMKLNKIGCLRLGLRVGLKLILETGILIGCNKYILSVIENDYVIPFFTTPKKLFLQNNQSTLKNSEFVSEAVSELLNTGIILEVDKKYGVCSKSSFS